MTHDFVGYPSLEHLTYDVFARVMAQVEGGDLLVVQRGHEPAPRHRCASSLSASSVAAEGRQRGYVAGGWRDGPWWRQQPLLPGEQRSLNMVRGGVAGAKLARASAESYAADFYAPYGGVGAAARKATEGMTESNPVRNSHVFLAVQAVLVSGAYEALTAAAAAAEQQQQQQEASRRPRRRRSSAASSGGGDDAAEQLVSFAICLHDPEHRIDYSTFSQSFPLQWAQWLDAPSSASAATPDSASSVDGEGDALDEGGDGGEASSHRAGQARAEDDDDDDDSYSGGGVGRDRAGDHAARSASRPHARPAEIDKIIQQGGADPREWVAEWIEEIISLGVAIVAQRYVARRMGIGEGAASDAADTAAAAADEGAAAHARAAPRQQALESGGGEAARAI